MNDGDALCRDLDTRLDDRYRLLRVIGQGGFGCVYEALDERLNRRVAAKVLQDGIGLESFRREAVLLAGMQHPNVVRVLDAGDDDGNPFLILELLEGESLGDHLELVGALTVERTLEISDAVLQGLIALHGKTIVHGDMKPSNVMLTKRLGIKLIDFGISRPASAEWDTFVVEGTPAYVAPEVIRGERPTPQSDLYGVGLLLYGMLTGLPAFRPRNTAVATFQAVLDRDFVSPQQLRPALDLSVVAFVETAMALDPEERFTDAAQMLHAQDFLRRSVRLA